jgi:hypothetical protein
MKTGSAECSRPYCARFNAVALVATENLDQWLGPNSGQLTQRLHFTVALLALSDFPYLLAHRTMMWMKTVGTMEFRSVRLRKKDKPRL